MRGTKGRWVALVAVTAIGAGCTKDTGANDGGADTSATTPTGSGESTAAVAGSEASTAAPATSTGSGSASSGGGDVSGGSESESGDPIDKGESGAVRFVAFGDTGEGNEAQHMVANAAEVVCAELGCDFAMLLGDNFYDVGVTAVDDPQFATKFENVYNGLDMPFYIVLGNHDYGTLANDWDRGQYQIDYGLVNPKWVMPHFWYTFSSESGDTQFFAFDTQRMMWDYQTDVQAAWFDEQMAASSASWKVGIAHHPYISNGEHGNAGNYEG